MFAFGIEHEVAFTNSASEFADYAVESSYRDFSAIIAQMPIYHEDYPQLIIGDAGIRVKRWYLEGLERFDDEGHLLTCLSKGIEIRTSPHSTIQGAVDELSASFLLLRDISSRAGFVPLLCSFNPYRTTFVADPPFNAYEQGLLDQSPEDKSALLSMLTYGPDLSFSLQGLSNEEIIDLGCKLTYYSPSIVPFTYSSPFYAGALWEGLSVRTFLRTGLRPAVLVFLDPASELLVSNPSLTKRARIPAEIGRIEFKACDACADFNIYAGLLALLKGLALDTTLSGRSMVPDAVLHQASAHSGFADPRFADGARELLIAAERALAGDEDCRLLGFLKPLLQDYQVPAMQLISTYRATNSIIEAMRQGYALLGDFHR